MTTGLSPSEQEPLETRGPSHSHAHGPVANERLTSSVALVLLVLLAVEGLTVVRIGRLLSWHIFVGALLVPPIFLKIGSTVWRFAKYYSGSRPYRRRGPPPLALRIIGPATIVLTLAVFASGFALIVGPYAWRGQLLFVHRASFVLWFVVMTIHVWGHLPAMARVSWQDWAGAVRHRIAGAPLRRAALAVSLVLGVALAFWALPYAHTWFRGPT